jgi:methylenetetrahydrofolate reductase (NADPH)
LIDKSIINAVAYMDDLFTVLTEARVCGKCVKRSKEGGEGMFPCSYIVEILTPKRSPQDRVQERLASFAHKYERISAAGCGVSIPDNPMGQLRLSGVEAIRMCGLPVDSAKTIMNLNSFHTKEDMDGLLKTAQEMSIQNLLIVRGDGSPELPKLEPRSIGGERNIATSMDLLRYISKEHSDTFATGAAFNQYNPIPFETNRLKEKIEAGARFVVTQPVIGKDQNVDLLKDFGIPVIIEAWMSRNVDLLYRSVRKQKDERAERYDPIENLKRLHDAYAENCIYLSLLSFKEGWEDILPRL